MSQPKSAAAKVVVDCSVPVTDPEHASVVALDADELKQRELDGKAAIEYAWVMLRSQRDQLLAQSDERMRPAPTDLPKAAASKRGSSESWAAYRQKLRDYPATVKDPLSPPPFPEPPA